MVLFRPTKEWKKQTPHIVPKYVRPRIYPPPTIMLKTTGDNPQFTRSGSHLAFHNASISDFVAMSG